MLKNIAAAKRLGHEVTLIIPREGRAQAAAEKDLEAALMDFGIKERFPLKLVPRPVVKGRGRRSFDLLAAGWARGQKFDLLWSREFQAARYSSAFGLKTIIEHHHPLNERQWKVARPMLARDSFKGIAAISTVHKDLLASKGWPEQKIITVHSGVDPLQFTQNGHPVAALRRQLAEAGEPLIAYAGSFYSGKGCEQVLLAAERLPQAKFVLLGGGEAEVAELRERIQAQRLANVSLTGRLPHTEVPAYLLAADVLVAPFTEDGRDVAGKIIMPFASPLKLFEYMATGKPIVTSKVGAIPEIINDQVNGLLVPPGDVEQLSQAISRLLADPESASRLGARARVDVQQYSWDRRVSRILEFAFA